jgi:4-hydroxymandelate oxidase
MARAVARSESILILSTFATTDVEAVVPAAGGRVWFQLYVYRDREVTRGLVERVEAAGCKALVLTVDVPLLGRRERDVRNRFRLPDGLTARNLLPAGYDKIAPAPGDSGLAMYAATMLDGSLNWTDLEWLRSVTRLPILVKGIVRADDAIARSSMALRGSSFRTTAAGSSTRRRPPSTCCPKSSRPSEAMAPSSWTVACGGGRTL